MNATLNKCQSSNASWRCSHCSPPLVSPQRHSITTKGRMTATRRVLLSMITTMHRLRNVTECNCTTFGCGSQSIHYGNGWVQHSTSGSRPLLRPTTNARIPSCCIHPYHNESIANRDSARNRYIVVMGGCTTRCLVIAPNRVRQSIPYNPPPQLPMAGRLEFGECYCH